MKKIRRVILLMVVALVGLLAVQWIWISNAIATKKQQFDSQVHNALEAVIEKLEKQEVVFQTQKRLKELEAQKLERIAQKKRMPRPMAKVTSRVQWHPDSIVVDNHVAMSDFEKINRYFDKQLNELLWEDLTRQRMFFEYDFQTIIADRQEKLQNLEIIEDEALKPGPMPPPLSKPKIKKIVKETVMGPRKLYERLDRVMLDTLIKQELNNRGISLPYHFGAKDAGNMIFSSFAVNYNPDVLQKAYRTALFPNDALSANQYLYVFFPNKDSFILKNAYGLFLTSFAIVLLIAYVFYAAVSTLITQKKLADTKSDFINNMTHEFKTPLATISLATQVLKDGSIHKDPQQINKYLRMISDENQRLGVHVERVLQMAQLDKGQLALEKTEVNLHDLIEGVCQSFDLIIDKAGGQITTELAATQPMVWGDEVHLTNVLHNLIDNAIKYTVQKPQIKIESRSNTAGVYINISDNGIGIKKEHAQKIFETFYRVAKGNIHDVKGFGLGLSYVKNIIQAHNGTVSVSSVENQGSTFEVFLKYHD